MNRGYFGIGIFNHTKDVNIGTLWRSATILNASFIFTIGRKYARQSSDTLKSYKYIPLYHYTNFEEFYKLMPYNCYLIGIEISDKSIPIKQFVHPERSIYLLGSENNGLPDNVMNKCHSIVQLPGKFCLNVSVAGSLVMFDRYNKKQNKL